MSKPKLLVICPDYPSENNLYANAFVHSRIKHYILYFEIQVLGYVNTLEQNKAYNYDGVNVFISCSKKEFNNFAKRYSPDIIAIHFAYKYMDTVIRKLNVPVLIWIHGAGAMGWYRRLYKFDLSNIISFPRYVFSNIRQMYFLRQLIKESNKNDRIRFIFVSDWIYKITQKDTLSKIDNYEIIPNPIDTELFSYQAKEPELRRKILLIRPFSSKKYANDIAIKAIEILSKKSFFSDLTFSIYGNGKYFKTLTRRISKFGNVYIYNTFVKNKNIPSIHKEHGILLCPTRQDTQGVSMCEAMSSGLVPVSSNNSGIPCFVDSSSGFLTDSAPGIAEAIKKIYHDQDLFISMSKKANQRISAISSSSLTIKREIDLLTRSVNNL